MRNFLGGALCALLLSACSVRLAPNYDDLSAPMPLIDTEVLFSEELGEAEAANYGLEPVDYNSILKFGLYRLQDGVTQEEVFRRLAEDFPDAAMEPNLERHALSNDPRWNEQWNMVQMRAEDAWLITRGAGVTVAVIDTGVFTGGRDTPVNMLPGMDFISNDSDANDTNGHGTHVAGTIAQATDNGIGVAGLAPDVNILPVRVLGTNGSGSSWGIAQGITWAVDNGADVLNLSLGSSSGSGAEANAVQYAISQGVVVVAATGNDGWGQISFPAAYPGVLSVGASDAGKNVTGYSNYGSGLDIVAPGGNTGADWNGDGYVDGVLQETVDSWGQVRFSNFQGTSMATPHVAAAAALLIAAGAEGGEVKDILTRTAEDLEGAGYSTRSGWGLLDPMAALDEVTNGSPPPPPPTQPPTPPTTPTNPTPPPVDTGIPTPPTPLPPPPSSTTFELFDIQIVRGNGQMELTARTSLDARFEVDVAGYGMFGNSAGYVLDHDLTLQVNPWETYVVTIHAVRPDGTRICSETFTVFPF